MCCLLSLLNILHLKSHDISFVTIARGGFNLSVPDIMGRWGTLERETGNPEIKMTSCRNSGLDERFWVTHRGNTIPQGMISSPSEIWEFQCLELTIFDIFGGLQTCKISNIVCSTQQPDDFRKHNWFILRKFSRKYSHNKSSLMTHHDPSPHTNLSLPPKTWFHYSLVVES